ncbi:hypothetical protein [Neorhizobium sp. S3-V5DH]|uniref:DUF7694 domain-containing protein n=1 Tax=Neorhizobium sp. S3-V5DH TaxID=2485166 RepID=UPI0010449FED|nr:hypothetical protein [Neorhizobium sp. S3-V5DH]TCV66327.1 hypothetical protein EDE09_11678 [Neorhizobium sp. S3-V5DH]
MSNRQQRLAARAIERKGLKGDWGPWRVTDLPDGIPGGSGWCKQVRSAKANNLYVVLIRPFYDMDGHLTHHCAIRTASNLEPPWRDLQRIKNELFGSEATAVQVMPPASELIDAADLYHIWVLPERLPFTLGKRKAA